MWQTWQEYCLLLLCMQPCCSKIFVNRALRKRLYTSSMETCETHLPSISIVGFRIKNGTLLYAKVQDLRLSNHWRPSHFIPVHSPSPPVTASDVITWKYNPPEAYQSVWNQAEVWIIKAVWAYIIRYKFSNVVLTF